jgi:HlyD family secretion protein
MSTAKTKHKKRNRIIIALIILIVLSLVVMKKSGLIGKEELMKVATEKVARRSIVEKIAASGKIRPEKEIMIAPDASGEIVGLYVKEGDSVKAGQLLLKINPDIYESNVEKALAMLNSAKANLANAKARLAQTEAQLIKAEADFKRSKELHEKGVISDSDFETAKSQYDVTKAQVEAAKETVSASQFSVKNSEAAVKEAQNNLRKTAVFSPIDGTVSKLSKELGERVAGASQFSGGTEVMRIANLNNMEVQVDVGENDIVRIHLNDTAYIEVDAYLGRKFYGVVTQIANSANSEPGSTDQVTNFKVRIRILADSYRDLVNTDNPNLSPFRPGMSASVDILTKYAANALSVPIPAVTTRTDTSSYQSHNYQSAGKLTKTNTNNNIEEVAQEYVFVYKDGKVKLRKVKTGIQDNNYFEITEGLEEGEEVVVAPYRAISKKLKNNQPVNKVPKEELFTE